MYYVYVLFSITVKKFYIGRTASITRRIKEHFSKKVFTTKRFGKLKSIYFEAFLSAKDAIRRERYFKTSKGRRSLRQIVRDSIKESEI